MKKSMINRFNFSRALKVLQSYCKTIYLHGLNAKSALSQNVSVKSNKTFTESNEVCESYWTLSFKEDVKYLFNKESSRDIIKKYFSMANQDEYPLNDFLEDMITLESFDKNFFNNFLYHTPQLANELNRYNKYQYFNSGYIDGTMDWLEVLIVNHHEDAYHYILKHTQISDKNKAAIELKHLKLCIDKMNDYRENKPSILSRVSDIISRGYIFKNSITHFNALVWIFSNIEITEYLAPQKLLQCLDSFSSLSVMAKKFIFKILINKKQEAIILNLLNKGIDLNWMIDFEGNGKKEVCSLRIIENLKLSEFLLSSEQWDIMAQNNEGNSILHIMCGSTLLDDNNIDNLEKRLNKLTSDKKTILLEQCNNKELTPMQQAILLQDEIMIDLLLKHGVKKWGSKDCPLTFLHRCLYNFDKSLLPGSLYNVDTDIWYELLQKWQSEKTYLELNASLMPKDKKKTTKI